MAAPGIVTVKSFTYRDDPEEYSNRWHFQGSAPTTEAGWRALCDDFIAEEKALYPSSVHIVRVICYADTDDHSVYTYELSSFGGTVAGTCTPTGNRAPGDTVSLLRWNTGRRNSKGKPIYLFKYLHPAYCNASDPDHIDGGTGSANTTFVSAIIAASSDWPGLAGPDGEAPTGYLAEPWLTTRTLKRRGRRPT